MKKKLSLAAALIPNPDLLFLDEPFEGVDAVASRVLRDTLKQCVRHSATVFLTSHVLEMSGKTLYDVASLRMAKWCIRARWPKYDVTVRRWRTNSSQWSAMKGMRRKH